MGGGRDELGQRVVGDGGVGEEGEGGLRELGHASQSSVRLGMGAGGARREGGNVGCWFVGLNRERREGGGNGKEGEAANGTG